MFENCIAVVICELLYKLWLKWIFGCRHQIKKFSLSIIQIKTYYLQYTKIGWCWMKTFFLIVFTQYKQWWMLESNHGGFLFLDLSLTFGARWSIALWRTELRVYQMWLASKEEKQSKQSRYHEVIRLNQCTWSYIDEVNTIFKAIIHYFESLAYILT